MARLTLARKIRVITLIVWTTQHVSGAATVAVSSQPGSAAVNPVTNKIYVVNNGSANVTVIDGASNTAFTVAVGIFPLRRR